jgi:hypothetical protein
MARGGGDVNHIRILQALSTFFVGEQPPSPGCSYPLVSVRCLAAFLNLDAAFVQDALALLQAQGFLELTRFEARLTPSRWALNGSRYASYLSFYVANAPFNLRGAYSQLPIDPQRCYNPQPELQGQNTTIASNFNGVYSSSQFRESCDPPAFQGPFELLPSWHGLSFPAAPVAENLNFLVSSTKLLFRSFLSGLWQQGLTEETAYGPATLLLKEFVEQTPCLVAAPCDDLGLFFGSPTAAWTPHAFLAPACVTGELFACPAGFPLSFPSLAGGSVVLHFSGAAEVQAPGAEVLHCFYQLVGPTRSGSFLVALVACAPSQLAPQAACPCPV